MLVASDINLTTPNGPIKVSVFHFGRNGTKSPKLEMCIDAAGKRYTPYALKIYGFYFTLNDLFKIIYSRNIQNIIPSGITLMSRIPKDTFFNNSGVFPVPIKETP